MEELIRILKLLKPIIKKNKYSSVSDCVCFFENEIIYHDDEICVSIPFKSELEGYIEAKKLISVLEKLNLEKIEFQIEKEFLVINQGKKTDIKLSILPVNENDLPWPESNENNIALADNIFHEALTKTSMSAAKSIESHGVLNGILFENGQLIGCDFHQIAIYSLENFKPDPFIAPLSCISRLLHFTPLDLYQEKDWITFECNDSILFSFKTVYDEPYPDISQYLNKDGSVLVWPDDTEKTISRLKIFNDEAHFEIKKGKIKITAKSDNSRINETLKIKDKDINISFIISCSLLLSIFKETKTCIVNPNSLYFESGPFQYLISLKSQK